MQRFNLFLPEKLNNRLRTISQITDTEMSTIVRHSLEKYFKETNLNYTFPTCSGQFGINNTNEKGV